LTASPAFSIARTRVATAGRCRHYPRMPTSARKPLRYRTDPPSRIWLRPSAEVLAAKYKSRPRKELANATGFETPRPFVAGNGSDDPRETARHRVRADSRVYPLHMSAARTSRAALGPRPTTRKGRRRPPPPPNASSIPHASEVRARRKLFQEVSGWDRPIRRDHELRGIPLTENANTCSTSYEGCVSLEDAAIEIRPRTGIGRWQTQR